MSDAVAMDLHRGDWQQTYTGRAFYALDPRADEVFIEDIAHALALQCRFGGHCRVPYSVAEHSVRVSWLVGRLAEEGLGPREREELALAALLHDASEAYCVDVPRPIKPHLEGYREIERRVAAAVAARFGFAVELFDHVLVKHADEALLATEARDLMVAPPRAWNLRAAPIDGVIQPWTWEGAEASFLRRFNALTRDSQWRGRPSPEGGTP